MKRGGCLLCVNESTWEHMKLLFFPTFLFRGAGVLPGTELSELSGSPASAQ